MQQVKKGFFFFVKVVCDALMLVCVNWWWLICCRFHSLGEFDEVKRSCRKRLDGHNRRRRKPQPPSLFMAAEKFLTSYKGLWV